MAAAVAVLGSSRDGARHGPASAGRLSAWRARASKRAGRARSPARSPPSSRYPAASCSGRRRAPYVSATVARRARRALGFPASDLTRVRAELVRGASRANRPSPAGAVSPGAAWAPSSTDAVLERLAAQGYVVARGRPSRGPRCTTYPTAPSPAVPSSLPTDAPSEHQARGAARRRPDLRVAHASHTGPGRAARLRNHVDLSRDRSRGTFVRRRAAAIEAGLRSPSIDAVADLDGTVWGRARTQVTSTPTLVIAVLPGPLRLTRPGRRSGALARPEIRAAGPERGPLRLQANLACSCRSLRARSPSWQSSSPIGSIGREVRAEDHVVHPRRRSSTSTSRGRATTRGALRRWPARRLVRADA
jgi:hypothetical protein